MKTRGRILGCLAISLAVLGISLASACGDPGRIGKPGVSADGFRKLDWGIPERAATERYPDLAFVRYALPAGDAEPSRVYVREREDREVFGVTFDRVEYWFREDGFRRVTAVMQGNIGPRTIRSRCEASFDRAAAAISERYGKPAEDREGGVIRYGRIAVWRAGGLRMVLSRSVDGGDVETLSLEISR